MKYRNVALVVFVIIIALAGVYSVSPKHVMFPPSNKSDGDNTSKVEISTFNSELLNGIIALIALIITFTAFIIPLMLLAIDSLQKSFFDTAIRIKCVKSLSDDMENNILSLSKIVKDRVDKAADLYKRMLVSSIVSLIFGLFLLYLIYNFESMLQYLWSMIFMYIIIVIIILLYIAIHFFTGKPEPYPLLARIQEKIILDIIEEKRKMDKEQQNEPFKTEKNINLNINIGFKSQTQDNPQK